MQSEKANGYENIMEIELLAIPEVKIIKPKIFLDERGHFSETYNQNALANVGIIETFVQVTAQPTPSLASD